jgi:hypothetical protein
MSIGSLVAYPVHCHQYILADKPWVKVLTFSPMFCALFCQYHKLTWVVLLCKCN